MLQRNISIAELISHKFVCYCIIVLRALSNTKKRIRTSFSPHDALQYRCHGFLLFELVRIDVCSSRVFIMRKLWSYAVKPFNFHQNDFYAFHNIWLHNPLNLQFYTRPRLVLIVDSNRPAPIFPRILDTQMRLSI